MVRSAKEWTRDENVFIWCDVFNEWMGYNSKMYIRKWIWSAIDSNLKNKGTCHETTFRLKTVHFLYRTHMFIVFIVVLARGQSIQRFCYYFIVVWPGLMPILRIIKTRTSMQFFGRMFDDDQHQIATSNEMKWTWMCGFLTFDSFSQYLCIGKEREKQQHITHATVLWFYFSWFDAAVSICAKKKWTYYCFAVDTDTKWAINTKINDWKIKCVPALTHSQPVSARARPMMNLQEIRTSNLIDQNLLCFMMRTQQTSIYIYIRTGDIKFLRFLSICQIVISSFFGDEVTDFFSEYCLVSAKI